MISRGDLEGISRGSRGDLEGCSRGGDMSLDVNSAGAVGDASRCRIGARAAICTRTGVSAYLLNGAVVGSRIRTQRSAGMPRTTSHVVRAGPTRISASRFPRDHPALASPGLTPGAASRPPAGPAAGARSRTAEPQPANRCRSDPRKRARGEIEISGTNPARSTSSIDRSIYADYARRADVRPFMPRGSGVAPAALAPHAPRTRHAATPLARPVAAPLPVPRGATARRRRH